jgi:endonuclease III
VGKPQGETRAPWFAREDHATRRKRVATLLRRLRATFGGVPTGFLDHRDPFQLLVAVILSAQNTDANVNKITPALFARWETPQDFLASAPGELEEMIRSAGYYNQKARSIRGMCARLLEEHGGEVPRTMEGLLSLPGVARKTANVVLSQAFGINEGIAVDTHVHRLAWRLGLSEHTDTNKVEQDLLALVPKARRGEVTNLLILHGRATCTARSPRCGDCVIEDLCPASRVAQTSIR